MNKVEYSERTLKSLENNIEYLLETIKMAGNKDVNISGFDVFNEIIDDIGVLDDYSNKSPDETGVMFGFFIVHLKKQFFENGKPKKYVNINNYEGISECLNEIKILKNKNNTALGKFFGDTKFVYRTLKSINRDSFLKNSDLSINDLENYERIMKKYKSIIDDINEIKPYMDNTDFENLNLDLRMNYSGLKANLNQIYMEIINSNMDIVEPLFSKLKRSVYMEDYTPVLNTSMVNKVINYGSRRKELKVNLDMLIESLSNFINRYQFVKNNRDSSKIDIDLPNKKIQEDYQIDIPSFIEENYNEHRMLKQGVSLNPKVKDSKVSSYIQMFEKLKKEFLMKKNHSKEEVLLYNRLESELDSLKNQSDIGSYVKFHYYFNKLLKKIKLSKENEYKQVINDIKKRK